MNKLQIGVVLAATVLFLTLFFGFDIKPSTRAEIDQKRVMMAQTTDIGVLIRDVKDQLTTAQRDELSFYDRQLHELEGAESVEALKKMSGIWYDAGHPTIAGHYAEQVAEELNTEDAWSIAGTTYVLGLRKATTEKVRTFSTERAVQAFENAISINPENPAHRLNLALTYTDNPPADQPMKGILMLIDLNKKYPDNVAVLTNLGRLAIQTGQFEKAITRLERARQIEPGRKVECLLADAYAGAGRQQEAATAKKNCAEMAQ